MAPKPERHIVAKVFANATTKLGLATFIAALCLTVVPIDGAAADVQISAARGHVRISVITATAAMKANSASVSV